jgi:hypothetical protein
MTKQLEFSQAINEVIDGKRITRIAWHNNAIFGELKGGFLMLHKDNEYKHWVISDGDLLGMDWVVVEEAGK